MILENGKRQIALRLPPKLNEWIEQQAEKNDRSLNRQMVFLLEMTRAADALGTVCFNNIHVFRGKRTCSCGLKVDKDG